MNLGWCGLTARRLLPRHFASLRACTELAEVVTGQGDFLCKAGEPRKNTFERVGRENMLCHAGNDDSLVAQARLSCFLVSWTRRVLRCIW